MSAAQATPTKASPELEERQFHPRWSEQRSLADGTPVLLRMLLPGDGALLARGFLQLSPSSGYRRFFAHKSALSEQDLRALTACDGERHLALGAVALTPDGLEQGIGIARFIRTEGAESAEAAVTVLDAYQRQGFGKLLLERLCAAASERGIRELRFYVLIDNAAMSALLRRLSPGVRAAPAPEFGGAVALYTLPL